VVVPRPLSNFMDNLPSEERLASDGPWTLFEPTKKLINETKDDIAEKVQRLCLGPPADTRGGQALLEDAPAAARGGTLAAEVLDMGHDALEWAAGGGRTSAAAGGAREEEEADETTAGAAVRPTNKTRLLSLENGASEASAASPGTPAHASRGKGGGQRSGGGHNQIKPDSSQKKAAAGGAGWRMPAGAAGGGSSAAGCAITRNAAHLRPGSARRGAGGGSGSSAGGLGSASQRRGAPQEGGGAGAARARLADADLAPSLLQRQARAAVARAADDTEFLV